jgi:shikimate 5-dehydrogenase
MLINQAAASFALWTGVEPETNITKLDLIND